MLFLDDYLNYLWTFPILNKSQVYSQFHQLKAYINTKFQREVKNFQCDHGKEYVNGQF